ncbi:MAG TPA: TRAFs-binding domain-containing protein [Bacteroidales bacterium]|nr:TRAFs-binding domain-containing protein [Bacteroidales bacterium]HOR81941.1 TRAFs-binding domain-containing protein [Bacteroidales bacterium]HPJ91173.1 TRAFs-binding domain-containing protein [Bacteroidales bacterium]
MTSKKICFVITGFGPKTDFETGRIIDLDKTYEHLIKPVFDELKITCFRAKDIKHSGTIDVPMYEWIYKADIVIADVSTLNANALYELGVRHALRPNSTIVISEDQTKYPFDLNHTVITKYEHLGKDIGASEVIRFKAELKSLIQSVLRNQKNDSPVYTYLPKLKPPVFSDKELELITETPKNQVSLSELISDAENAKNNNDFGVAIMLYKACLNFEPQNVFLKQRLALVTYKYEKPNPKKALLNAENILDELNPEETTDIETLGLSGAINKRLFELSNDQTYLDKSIKFYSKGYHIAQDYYNGINYSYLLTLKSTLIDDKYEAISYFIQSQIVREQIVSICINLIKQKTFKKRNDKEWIYQSLAQAYLGLDKQDELNTIIEKINKLSKGQFDLDTFKEHNKKLIDYINKFNKKHKL